MFKPLARKRQVTEIGGIVALAETRDRSLQPLVVDEPGAPGDLLRAGDLHPLPPLERGDELGGLEQTVGRAGVEPGKAAAHHFDVQLAALEIGAVDVGDLEFAAGRRLDVGGDVDDLLVVEIEPGDGPVRLGLDAASPRC